MKAKRLRIALMYVLAALFTAVAGFALSACTKEPEAKAGDEAGVYYYDAEDDVYHVTLGEDLSLKLDIRGTTTTGVFSREGEKLTFNYETKEAAPELPLEAEYRDNAVILSYDGAEMRFLRKEYYTVKFEVEAGSVSDVSVLNGKTVAKPADPVREGYRFYGWYTDENCTTPFLFGTQAVREDTTLYGHWAKQTEGELVYTVDFDLGYEGAEEIPAMDTVGGKLYHVQTPERDGHVFSGWWVSMYESRDKLSYAFADGETEFKANTTLFALWDNDAPTVNVNANGASWASVGPAVNYEYEVTGPEGFRTMHETIGSTNLAIDFANAPAGEYTVKVTANGKTAVRSYANKTLDRVSLFTVAEPSVLLFNNVEHATKYLLTVDCGNPAHNHTELDNGNSTHYSFVNCEMQQGGIKFKVKAVGNGYASSESEWFVYDRTLGAVTGLTVDETEEKAVWNSVPFATNYIVSVNCGNSSHTHDLVDNGSATSFSLKNCSAGTITVKVYPKTKGYNSPLAAEYEYEKKSLASPDGLQVNGSTLTWNGVQGANGYEVRVGDQTMSASGTSLDLSTSSVSWTAGGDYSISVRAMGQGSVTSSVWSDELDVRYQAMGESLTYYRNRVSWKPVVGATRYEVKVNGGQIVNVDEGNSAEVTLTRAGDNTIEVRFTDGKKYSEWVKLNVYAYTVEFDARSGQSVPEQYVAAGDKVVLPETTRTGYEIDGWYNAPGGAADNAKEYTDEYFAEGQSIMLFANWTPKHYIVKYYDTKGTAGTAEVVFGQPFTFDIPISDDGTVFYGWYSDPNGIGMQFTDPSGKSVANWNIDQDEVVVHAYWASVLKYNEVVVSGTVTGYAVTRGIAIGSVTEIRIPSEYQNLPVVAVNALAFESCTSLRKVSIPETVGMISPTAFRNCSNIQEFEVYHVEGADESEVRYVSSDGMVIEKFDVDDNPSNLLVLFPVAKTGTIVLPELVKKLGNQAIASAALEKLVIPASVTRLDAKAIYACQKLTEIEFESPEGSSATELSLAAQAFYSLSNLQKVVFPSNLGETTFYGNDSVFAGCVKLAEVEIDGENAHYSSKNGMLYNTTESEILFCPTGREGKLDFTAELTLAGIGTGAFYGCANLTEVVFPGQITEIGESAFYNCTGLVTVTFSAKNTMGGVVIGKNAFANCSALKNLVFEEGSNVSEIGDSAFYSCTSLEELTLPSTLTSLGASAFSGCLSLETVKMENGESELTLDKNAFHLCSSLVSFYISKNVTKIDDTAFSDCAILPGVELDPGNTSFIVSDGVLFDYNVTKIIFYPSGKVGPFAVPSTITEIGAAIFKNNKNITEITIPKTVTSIAKGAFYGCTALTKVFFEEGTVQDENGEDIGLELEAGTTTSNAIFGGCLALEYIHFPARLKVLSNYVVYGGSHYSMGSLEKPTALTTVEFGDEENPSKLQEIGNYALYHNENLVNIAIPETVTKIGTKAFSFTGVTSIALHAGTTFGTAFLDAIALKSVTLEEGITEIPNEAFRNTSLEKIEIPASVANIGNYAFAPGTTNTVSSLLAEVTFAEPAEGEATVALTLGNNVFYRCVKLTKIVLPKRVTRLGYGVFQGCTLLPEVIFEEGTAKDESGEDIPLTLTKNTSSQAGLAVDDKSDRSGVKKIHFPARLEEIPEYAVGGTATSTLANPVQTVEFGDETHPSKLKTIGKNAFQWAQIEHLVLPASLATIGESAFTDNKQLEDISFAAQSELASLGKQAFANCAALTSADLSNVTKLAELGEGAFSGCAALGDVKLPQTGLTAVGAKAFFAAASLQTISLPEGIETIAASAFENSGLTALSVPASVKTIGERAFAGTSALATVTFGTAEKKSVLASIGKNAFEGANIAEITLPASLKELGAGAFKDCASLSEIKLEGGNVTFSVQDGILYDFAKTKILVVPMSKTGKVTVPNTVTVIGEGSFTKSKISAIEFAEGGEQALTIESAAAKEDGAFAFAELTAIVLPDRLTEIGAFAFYGSSVQTATLSKNLATIGASAFADSALATLNFHAETSKLTAIGASSFENTALATVTLPACVETIDKSGFGKNASLTSFNFAEGSKLQTIGESAFDGCDALQSFAVPKTVQTIGKKAFYGTSALETVTFDVAEGALESVGESAFENSAIAGAALPAKLQTIGQKAFENATSLASVTFGDDEHASELTTVDSYAFQGSGLTEFTLPATVTILSTGAFDKTADMESFTFAEGSQLKKFSTTAGGNATGVFTNSGITSFAFPDDFEAIIGSHFTNCNALTSITLPANYAIAWAEGTSASTAKTFTRAVFNGAPALSEVNIADSNAMYQSKDGVLFDKGMKTLLYYPAGKLDTTYQEDNFVGYKVPDSVTVLGAYAFYQHEHLTKIFIPNTVEIIRNHVFGNGRSSRNPLLPLKEVVFEEGGTKDLYIGQSANASAAANPDSTSNGYTFTSTSLKEFTVPSRTVFIAQRSFYACKDLTTVTYEEGTSLARLPEALYSECSNLSTVNFPKDLTAISGSVFNNTAVKNIVVPEGVREIKNGAFSGSTNGLESLTLPSTLQTIGSASSGIVSSTSGKSLTSVTFARNTPNLTALPNNAFKGLTALKQITLPENVTSIGESAFQGCTALESIDIPERVMTIKKNAFNGTGLTSFSLPQSVKEIGESAFASCPALTSFTFEGISGVTAIAKGTFNNSALTSFTLPKSVTEIGDTAFLNCASLESFTFEPDSAIQKIGKQAFKDCVKLGAIDLPEGLTDLGTTASGGGGVFQGCVSLTEISFPSTLAVFGGGSFSMKSDGTITAIGMLYGCTELQRVEFARDAKITELGVAQFAGCPKLVEVILPDELASIGDYAFYHSFAVSEDDPTTITLPLLLETIGKNAFEGSGLQTVNLVDTQVVSIGDYAFAESASLVEVYLPDSLEQIANYVFQNCAALQTVSVGVGVTSIGDYAFDGCVSLKGFTVSAGMAYLGANPFRGVPEVLMSTSNASYTAQDAVIYSGDLKTLISYPANGASEYDVLEGVTAIAEGAFSETNIETVTLPATVATIGKDAFLNAKSLRIVNFATALETNGEEIEGVIEDGAFRGTSLMNVTIPSGFVTIGKYAFADCANLLTASLSDTVTTVGADLHPTGSSAVNGNAFQNCPALTTVKWSKNAASFGQYAFSGDVSLKTITDIEHITAVDAYAFQNAGIESFDFTNITTLGQYSFSGSKLKSVFLPATIKNADSSTTTASYVFMNCTELSEVKFGDGFSAGFGWFMFSGTALTDIKIPKDVNSMGSYGFKDCTMLKNVEFETGNMLDPAWNTSTGLFEGCIALEEITLPASFTRIQDKMFEGCTSLTAVHMSENVIGIGNSAFANCVKLTSFTLPAEVTSISPQAFVGSGLTSFTFNEKLTQINSEAFKGLSGLSGELVLPDSVTSLGAGAFAGTGYSKVVIGDNVDANQNNLFEGCVNLETAEFGTGTKWVGKEMFKGCVKLHTVIHKGTLTRINASAFEGCTAMAEYHIPETVTWVEANAFTGWTSAQKLFVPFAADNLPVNWKEGWNGGCGAKIAYAQA